MSISRRSFLKSTAAGVAGVSLAGAGVRSVAASSQDGLVWTDKMPINPEIDNMRVICMHDEGMAGEYGSENFKNMNDAVDEDKVRENMDGMARHLTRKSDTQKAWQAIFRSSKPWPETKVLIKLNNVAKNMCARTPVIKKITDVLTEFGVKPENIVLFDGQGQYWDIYKDEVSLTDTSKIAGKISKSYDDLGGQADVTVPGVNGGYAPGDLVNGDTDIIVNIAVNKGHNSNFNVGKTTLCLKNHYGTFLKDGGFFKTKMYGGGLTAMHLHNAKDALTNINKTFAVVGGDPVRQQLCIIDTLWAIKGNVTGAVTHKPDRLIMGTFAGAVDYCCAKKVREDLMKVTNHEQENITKFLTEFGYTESDPEWIEVTPDMVKVEKVNQPKGGEPLVFSAKHSSFRRTDLKLSLVNGNGPVTARVFDMKGACIRTLHQSSRSSRITWDGKTSSGRSVSSGTYLIKIRAGSATDSGRISFL